ncbi:MAG: hypothetical protein ACOYKE_14845, partial [Ferruginibacter sp.]
MKKLLLFIFLPLQVYCQNTIGFPDVFNYARISYGAGLQNWEFKQDVNGIIYVANNEGMLSFDGMKWKLNPLPNKTIVRSIEIGIDQRIYVGGQDEIGYFAPALNGKLKYHSLKDSIPLQFKSFGDVWDIVTYQNDIYFRTTTKIFKYKPNAVTVFEAPSEWSYLGICNNLLYAHDYKAGLTLFNGKQWQPVSLQNPLPKNDPV